MRYPGKLGEECEDADLHCIVIPLCYTFIDLIKHLNI